MVAKEQPKRQIPPLKSEKKNDAFQLLTAYASSSEDESCEPSAITQLPLTTESLPAKRTFSESLLNDNTNIVN